MIKRKNNTLILIPMLFMSLGISKCRTGEPIAPDIKIYLGEHDISSICRENDAGNIDCVFTSDKEFSQFQCAHNDDVIKVFEYINELRHKCARFEGEDK